MPGFDGTGPTGAGPMTGGGRGRCSTGRRGSVERPVRSAIRYGLRFGCRGRALARGRGLGQRFGYGRW